MTTDFKTLHRALQCQWVGPMPIESFLQGFLEIDQTKLEEKPKLPEEYFGSISHVETLSELHLSFIKLVRDSSIMPNLKLFPCLGSETDHERRSNLDIAAYDSDFNSNPNQAISYEHCELLFKLGSLNVDSNMFEDLSEEGTAGDLETFLSQLKNKVPNDCRAQLTYHARAWMSRQHRNHCFMVWIGDPWARIIRFDRSGAIVTERFSIRSSRLLVEFLWRFSCASPEMRGKDTTVSTVTDDATINLVQEKLKKWAPDPKSSQHVLELKILEGGSFEDPQWRKVLVWGSLTDPHWVVGRATRGYPAWDIKDKKLVFTKDSWRLVSECISKETDLLKTLNDAEVRNVPRLLSGDDLPGQVTRTQEFASAEWNRGGHPEIFSKRAHIRFTSDLIGTHLTKFKCSKEFVQAWHDALLAHREAYEKCRILHRDISLNNILLTPEGRGFLNDWDLARAPEDIEGGPQPRTRSGTWRFMSVNILENPAKKHTIQDDLESFFWLLLYVIIRYLVTSLEDSEESIPSLIAMIFDTSITSGKFTVSGGPKLQVVTKRRHIGQGFYVKDNVPLTGLVNEIQRVVGRDALYWLNLDLEVERLVEDEGVTLESATERYRQAREKFLDLRNHDAMLASILKALDKDWPTADAPCDQLVTDNSKPNKRRAADFAFFDERTAKRVKQ